MYQFAGSLARLKYFLVLWTIDRRCEIYWIEVGSMDTTMMLAAPSLSFERLLRFRGSPSYLPPEVTTNRCLLFMLVLFLFLERHYGQISETKPASKSFSKIHSTTLLCVAAPSSLCVHCVFRVTSKHLLIVCHTDSRKLSSDNDEEI